MTKNGLQKTSNRAFAIKTRILISEIKFLSKGLFYFQLLPHSQNAIFVFTLQLNNVCYPILIPEVFQSNDTL